MKQTKIEVFKPGRYGDAESRIWSTEEVKQMVDNYDPDYRDAPVILGHNDWSGEKPAVGWVKQLEMNDDGVVEATVEYGDWLKEISDEKMYRRVSIEATKKIEMFDVDTGKSGPYMLAVALLGGSQPAVSGLKPVQFDAEMREFVEEFEFGSPTDEVEMADETTVQEVDKMTAGEDTTPNTSEQETQMSKEEVQKFEAERKRLEEEKAKLKAEREAFLREKRKIEIAAFMADNEKKIVPAVADKVKSFMEELSDEQLEKFKEIVKEMPDAEVFTTDMGNKKNDDPETNTDEKFQKQALEDLKAVKQI